ncbi:hypothetical protein L1049_007902 [Liquidambar formosana]|uniref:VHS domain-containing protein n=1 Tax=Liquidambar formosana TaxID=63359 RepID=A0AAP0S2N3_LIQFO
MSSSSSATVRVEKATSDLLIGPDWTMNIDICDSINSNHWQAKDVVKAVKKRLQHRNSKVQLLALTLLETMVKNCGDYVHFQIAERNILPEMIKIVKKKSDMHVRDKVLVLLDSWQEAFGGPGGKHPQYYWAYEELRRSGVEFPKRSSDVAPIFTPPVTHPTLRHAQAGYGMPSNSSKRLDEAMASEVESLSLSHLDSMRNVMELLADMLQAVNPSDRAAVKDEVIIDLVNQCRSNQKKLMQMLTSTGYTLCNCAFFPLNWQGRFYAVRVWHCYDYTSVSCSVCLRVGFFPAFLLMCMCLGLVNFSKFIFSLCGSDEELLGRGLELNDSLQSLLAKHDAIASGSPLPTQVTNSSPQPIELGASTLKPTDVGASSPRPDANPSTPVAALTRGQVEEEEEEEDDFAQLARRHSKPQHMPSQSTSSGTGEGSTSLNSSNTATSSAAAASTPGLSNALALPDPPAPVQTTKEQDMIDLLSLTLSTTSTSPHTPHTPHTHTHTPTSSASNQNMHQVPVAPTTPVGPTTQGYPYASQAYPGNQGQVPYNSYVVPWAQPQPQPQRQPQYPQYSPAYPPPPWAATPGYYNNQNPSSSIDMFSTPKANTSTSYMPMQGVRPAQQYNSFPARGSNGSAMHGDPQVNSSPRNPASAAAQKPFVPSYRLFEDLNVLGNVDGRFKMTSSASSSLSGTSGQGMVTGRK